MRTMKKSILFTLALLVICASTASAQIKETRVEYSQGGQKLVGYFYSNEKDSGQAPAVIVFSDWMGVGPFAKERAKDLVGLGYRAFVADIYGDEHRAKDTDEAGKLATKFKAERPMMRARAVAAFETVSKNPAVDPSKIAAMGFCFGGTASLELARSGSPLKGVVSFHGGLETPDTTLAKNIKGKILALHGADDPWVAEPEVKGFEEEMTKAGVNWELDKYSGAVHAFTNPEAGNDPSKGAAYNAAVAKRAYARMREFFTEIF